MLDLPLRGSESSDKNRDRVRCTKVLGDVGRRGLSYTLGEMREGVADGATSELSLERSGQISLGREISRREHRVVKKT